jgi:ribosome-binding protein aMBF1 (putative translation factor)
MRDDERRPDCAGETVVSHLGEMLTLYRAARRWTVRDVAPRLGISIATLSRIERGHAMDAATMLKVWQWLIAESDVKS